MSLVLPLNGGEPHRGLFYFCPRVRSIGQTYALVSIADSLHELTVQGLCHSRELADINLATQTVSAHLEEIAHRLKERE